jgi:hypothetical protein
MKLRENNLINFAGHDTHAARNPREMTGESTPVLRASGVPVLFHQQAVSGCTQPVAARRGVHSFTLKVRRMTVAPMSTPGLVTRPPVDFFDQLSNPVGGLPGNRAPANRKNATYPLARRGSSILARGYNP